MDSFRIATNHKFKHSKLNSLTVDNDKSYNNYEFIERDLQTSIYFAHPYSY